MSSLVLLQLLVEFGASLGKHRLPPVVVFLEELLHLAGYCGSVARLVRVVVEDLEHVGRHLLVVDECLLDIRRAPVLPKSTAACLRYALVFHLGVSTDQTHVLLFKRGLL